MKAGLETTKKWDGFFETLSVTWSKFLLVSCLLGAKYMYVWWVDENGKNRRK